MKRKYLATVATVIAALSAALVAHAQGRGRSAQHGNAPPQRSRPGPAAACSHAACPQDCLDAGTCLDFSGFCWDIKDSNGGEVGPGPNVFSRDNVSVDAQGRLHMEIANRDGQWTCAEVIARASCGYGTYQVTYDTPVDDLDPNAVLALFTWDNGGAQWHREIDIELSRFGDPDNPDNAQYVVQPFSNASRILRWPMPAVAPSTHQFDWQRGSVRFESFDGNGRLINDWLFKGKTASPGRENPRMNLWLFRGAAPDPTKRLSVIVNSFAFVP